MDDYDLVLSIIGGIYGSITISTFSIKLDEALAFFQRYREGDRRAVLEAQRHMRRALCAPFWPLTITAWLLSVILQWFWRRLKADWSRTKDRWSTARELTALAIRLPKELRKPDPQSGSVSLSPETTDGGISFPDYQNFPD